MTWNNDLRHRSRFCWTPELDQKLRDLRVKGVSYEDCGAEIGCSKDIISHRCKALKITRGQRNDLWSPEQDQKLRELWAAGLSTSAIGRELGVSKNAVAGRRQRLDLPERGSPIRRADGVLPRPEPCTPEVPELAESVEALKDTVEPDGKVRQIAPSGPLCQWIEGEPTGDDSCKTCTAPPIKGKPYCEEHHRRSWRRAQPGEAA